MISLVVIIFFFFFSSLYSWLHLAECFLLSRLMDKYARLMQKLEIINVEFFKVSPYLTSL